MTFPDLLALVWGNLRRMRGRVLLTALGVVVGTAAVVVLISLGAGLQRQALRQLGSAAQEIRLTGGSDMTGGATRPLLDAALLARIEALPGVEAVIPFELVSAPLDVEAGQMCSRAVRVMGVDAADFAALDFEAASGALDMQRGQALLGARVPETLGRTLGPRERENTPPDLVGETLTLYLARNSADGAPVERAVRVEVSGVLAPRGSAYDFAIYLPHREALALNTWYFAQRRDPTRQGHPEVLVKVGDVRQIAAIEGQLLAWGLNVFSEREQAESLGAYFTELQALLGGIAAISLLVAAFSIANTMLMAIIERTREIGLMKALGATHRDVMAVFLSEAGCIGLLGGVGGVSVGMGINGLINLLGGVSGLTERMFGAGVALHAFTPLWLPLFGIGFAVLIGVASGIYPAHRAAQMRPIAALKLG